MYFKYKCTACYKIIIIKNPKGGRTPVCECGSSMSEIEGYFEIPSQTKFYEDFPNGFVEDSSKGKSTEKDLVGITEVKASYNSDERFKVD